VEQTQRALASPLESGTGVALLMVCQLLGAARWRILLQAQGLMLSYGRALQLNMVGSFFNIALPGSVSGDLVKAYYLGHEAPGRQARAFGAILLDRVMGLSALLLVSAGAFFVSIPGTEDNTTFTALRWLIRVLAVGVLFFYAYLLLVHPQHDPLRRVLLALEARVSKVKAIREVYDGMRDFHGAPGAVISAMVISVVIHLLVGATFLAFAHAVGETWMQLHHIYATAPAGMVVTTIPVAPAGVGTGHAAFLFLFRLVGSERGADVFTLFAATQILIGMLGGLVYLWFKRAEPPAPVS